MSNEGMGTKDSRGQIIRSKAEDLEKYASEVKNMAWRVHGMLFGDTPGSDSSKGAEGMPGLIGRVEVNHNVMSCLLGSIKEALMDILEELE